MNIIKIISYSNAREDSILNLRAIRELSGQTQEEVADAIGCSTVVYSRYETGSRQPSIDMLISISDHFHVSVDFLLGRDYAEEAESLSIAEAKLLKAFRAADKRAQADAQMILEKHKN